MADAVYSRLTGEGGYFDSRVAFIAASGPKEARRKQLAIMDYDGANAVMLTDGSALVLTPRLSPDAQRVLYTSYEQGAPKVMMMEAGGGSRTVIDDTSGMTFAPRFSPDGRRVVFSHVGRDRGRTSSSTDIGGRGRDPADAELVDRHRAGLLAGRQPHRVRERPRRHAAALRHVGRAAARRRGSASATGATRRRSGRRAAT